MPLQWFFRFVDRTHVLLAPALILLLGGGVYGLLLATSQDSFALQELAYRHVVGTLALFVLLPAYLVAMLPVQRMRTNEALAELEALARPSDVAQVRARLERAPAASWIVIALASSMGLWQNPLFVSQMSAAGTFPLLDVAFIFGSSFTWFIIAVMLCWRLGTSRALSKLGENLDLDLYRLDKVRPLARVANTDVLSAVGAMAFMPLQSLDAEFRLGNYGIGFTVGTAAVIFLFAVPLWGIHRNIVRAKAARLRELYARIATIDRDDIPTLETVTSHVDRIRSLPNWPVDIQLVTRLFGYVIIPPLAWVAAALVENFIDSL